MNRDRGPLFTTAQLEAAGKLLRMTTGQRRPRGGIFGPLKQFETLAPVFTAAQLDAVDAELKRITEGLGK